MEIKATFTAPLEALIFLQQNEVDVLFLDIQMPGFLGTSLLKSIPSRPLTIFTTAYREYAVEGFDLRVVDYLLKPIPFERFVTAANKCLELINKDESESDEHIVIKLDKEYRKLKVSQICFIESLGNYVKTHAPNDVWIVHLSLKSLESRLEKARFMRVHKSYLVNEDFITGLFGNTLITTKAEIPVGESYRAKVREYFEGKL